MSVIWRDIHPKSHWQTQPLKWNSSACKCLRWSKCRCDPTTPEFLSGLHRLRTTGLHSYAADHESESSAYRSFAESAENAVWDIRASQVHRSRWHRYNRCIFCNRNARIVFDSTPAVLSDGAAILQTVGQAADFGSWISSLSDPFGWSCFCRLSDEVSNTVLGNSASDLFLAYLFPSISISK